MDDMLNVYNVNLLRLWKFNVDFYLVVYQHVFLKYTPKYASKVKRRLYNFVKI